jgi:very-short-patch-repair endonuclease/transcription elongation GreA/GreB family factor
MSSKFRIARAHALRLTRNAQKKKPRELADILERARLHIAAEAALAADSRLAQICGAHHDGIDTEFELLQKAADYYAKVDQIVGTDVEARRFLTDAPIAELRDFQAKVEEIRLHVAAYAGDSRTIADRLTAYQTIADNFALLSSAISNAHGCIPLSVRFSQFAQLGDNVAAYQFRATEADQLLSDLTAAIDTSELPSQPDQLRRLAADGRIIAKMPDWLRASAISADFAPDIEFAAARRTKDAWDVALKAFETLASFVSIDKKSFFDATPIDAIPTKEFERRASLCHQDRDNLVGWTEWLKSRESANEAGVRDFVDMALESGLPLNQIPDFYITAIRRAQADAVFNEHPKLKSFRGSNQEQARREFQILDRRIQSLGRRHIASKIHTRRPPEGISTGLVRNYTDLSLVKHEAYKTKKHAPIRQIFDRAFAAATALKPCVLASPLAVAQHLPRTNHRIDLLVIDEASQMRPEDAVGALARCGRAVIVGDQKQLPPSNFFLKSSIHEGEDDDNAELVVDEAILDRALAVFPSRGLRWHYRSRHPSLISYSNRTFYGDRLIVFPAADKDHPNLGVRLERVSGTFRNSVNVEEANAVVAAAVTHMKTRTTESLAVVTMNQPQRDFIQSEFDRLAVTDADIETYLRLWTEEREGLEPFIIKNLENIQGDERDVVLISCVYGPAELGGKVMQRFGPINGAAGDRRLNVLFSRAKCQVRVFASLSADHILADSGKAGLRVFREYLAYAATGNLDSSAESTGEPESPFEESVLAELRRCGFDGVPQVGVSGYFIDIGVRHRDWPWGFIMGIECDGASYHSSRSARDRDRLRQEVLEGLGWQLHRIWSTDWFHDHTTERNRLADALRRRMTELAPEAERRHKVLKEADKQAGQARRQAQAPATATNQSVQANLFTLPTAAAPPKPDAQTPPLANAIAISEMAAAAPSERASPERGIRVGDIVTYAFAREPNRPITITITENRYDPDNGFLSKNHPTVKQLLGYGEGSEIELSVANGVRYIRILEVLHSPADDA